MIFRRRDDEFDSFSITKFITRPFRRKRRRSERQDGIGGQQSIAMRLLSVLLFPLTLIAGFATFMVQSWATHRSGPAFLKGVASVLVVTMFLAGLWAANFLRESRSVASSMGYLQMHLEKGKFEDAEMFAEKLVELKPTDDSFKYQLGLLREQREEMDSALDVMKFIAPDDRVGYCNAHVWRAQKELRNWSAESGLDQRDSEVIKQLEYALQSEPDNSLALLSLSDFYQAKAREAVEGTEEYKIFIDKAIEPLQKVVVGQGEELTMLQVRAIPSLIQLLIDSGRNEEAKNRLELERYRISPVARRNADLFEIWYSLIRCAIQLKDYQLAQDIMQEALQLVTSEDVRRKLILLQSEMVLDRAEDFTDMKDREQFRTRFKMLCSAIEINPRNRAIYQKLLKFVAAQTNPDFNEDWLRELLVGSNSGIVQILLGMYEINQGNVSQGQTHWSIAQDTTGGTPFVINNLIDTAANDYPDDFSEILDMVSLAIELFPEHHLLYQTRGVYLMKQQQFQDAAVDLEHALEELPNMVSLHKYLIDCYEKLNQPDRVLEHQNAMEGILSELEFDQRRLVEASLDKL